MNELVTLSIVQALEGLKKKEFTAIELTQAHINEMDKVRDLNAYICETPDLALEMARASHERYMDGSNLPLDGIPIGMKDLFCTKGTATTAASRMLANFVPTYESTISQNLWDVGAVMLGKTNMDEFAMGSANLNSAFGPVKNPWTCDDHKTYVPGGSSGGSAAAVAAYTCMGATASDTGGSIRQPAAFCGLVGIKPTYGLCSRYGMIAFASSLDQAGPVTRTVADSALMLHAMISYDHKDSTSLHHDKPNYLANLHDGVKGLKVGLPREYQTDGLCPHIQNAYKQSIQWLKEGGAEIIDVSLPHTSYALPTYYILAPAEASSNLARYDGVRYGHRIPGETLDDMYMNTRGDGFGDEVIRRILVGTYVLSAGHYEAYFEKALKLRRLIMEDFHKAFEKVDVIFSPTTPTPPFAIGEEPKDPVSMYMNDVYAVPANIAGLPGISVPVGLSEKGLPIGVQMIGPAFSENKLFQAAQVLENNAQFSRYRMRKGA
jgi:aspartyl-tRNA(Asn)/glutamyl-tRNA(Gln) amidotransferase subunit A